MPERSWARHQAFRPLSTGSFDRDTRKIWSAASLKAVVPVLPPLLSVRLKLGIPEPLAVLSLRPAHLLVSSVTLTLASLLVTSKK